MQFKLDQRLARLLGMHTQTRPVIINALWQYIKTHKLQDPHEREYINCDRYLEQVCIFILFSFTHWKYDILLCILIQPDLVMGGATHVVFLGKEHTR